MKKIAILYPAHYEQSSGGAEIQILYLINACKQQNWEIHYIFEDKGEHRAASLMQDEEL